ncbi:carbon starvation, CstA domain protein [Mycobacterium kansasii]|uniref:Carbon starvation, CstA domain protein n=1 Tax=Mycobacterium kansasii TaxID=1768 RepID=A0A1V3XU30_MYCKA|nr:carbon starvation, CstA domain protein [Mycobacterium kansasii]OOK83897.1 carbon starvation, CstA domain protein [Mycobacterium kansasii]
MAGDVSYIHTDADLPPVAVVDRSPITLKHKVFLAVVAVIGAVAWAILALVRGETVNAVWLVVAAGCTYVIAFRFYARLIEARIVAPRDDHATPPSSCTTVWITCRPIGGYCSATISPPSPGPGRWSVPCWPPRWAICPARCGLCWARCSAAACTTIWCCGSPLGAEAVPSGRWFATSSALPPVQPP